MLCLACFACLRLVKGNGGQLKSSSEGAFANTEASDGGGSLSRRPSNEQSHGENTKNVKWELASILLAVRWPSLPLSAASDRRILYLPRGRPLLASSDENLDDVVEAIESVDAAVNKVMGFGKYEQNLEDSATARLKRLESAVDALGNVSIDTTSKEKNLARSAFSIINSTANRQKAEETLRKIRQKDAGELEVENAELIAKAQRGAELWLDAGLPKRALNELLEVEQFVSCKTELGGAFHLMLARVAEASGRGMKANQIRRRVSSEALSITQRKLAENALRQQRNSDRSGGSFPPFTRRDDYTIW